MGLNHDLYTLVRSLTNGDVNAVNSSRALSEQKAKLFAVFRKMKTYHHPTVVKAFPQLEWRHISALKSQLYRQLLEILASNPLGSATNLPIRFAEIDFLMRKGLLEQAYAHCLFAIKEAMETEEFDIVRRLFPLRWELEGLVKPLPSKPINQDYDTYEAANTQLALIALLDRIFHEATATRALPHHKREPALHKVLAQIPPPNSSESTRVTVLRLRIEYTTAWIKGDLTIAERSSSEIFELLIKKHKLLIDPEIRSWLFKSAKVSISFLVSNLNYKEAGNQIKRLKLFAQSGGITEENDIHLYSVLTFLRLYLLLNANDTHEGTLRVAELTSLIAAKVEGVKFMLFIESAVLVLAINFIHGNYKDVVDLFKLLTSSSRARMFPLDSVVPIYLYALASFFNVQDFDSLERLLQTFSLIIKKLDLKLESLNRVLAFFASVCKNSLPENISKQLNLLKKDLEDLSKESRHIKSFPFMLWIQSHLEKKPLSILHKASLKPHTSKEIRT